MASTRSSLEQLTNSRPHFPQGLQVLLVEPSSDQHTLQQLQELQYVVNCAKDIPAAVAALKTSSVDVIMADLSLVGDLAGDDASQLFSTAGNIPVVLTGSQCSPSQVLAAVEHGAADVLERPLSQLKLRNIWQHAVRAAMSGLGETQSASQDATAVDDLMAKHDAAADAAAAAAASLASASAAESLLQEQQRLKSSLVHNESCQIINDCYKDLDLPAFLPQQSDPEGLFLDLESPGQPGEPALDLFLQPGSPSGSAAADDYGSDQVLTAAMCSSEHHMSGATGTTAYTGELESCADTSTRNSSGMVSGLRSHGSLGDSAVCHGLQQSAMHSAAPAPATAFVTHQQQQQMLVPGCSVHPSMHHGSWGPHWGACGGPSGMVWGMPMYTVASAPGLPVPAVNKGDKRTSAGGSGCASYSRERYPSCTGSAAASASSSPTHKSRCTTSTASAAARPGPYLPSMVPPVCWPVLPPQTMHPYVSSSCSGVATGTQLSATRTASQMLPYPGMFPGMYPGMVPATMWPMCAYGPHMGMPGMGFPSTPAVGSPSVPGMSCPGMPGAGFPGMSYMPTMSRWSPVGMGTGFSWSKQSVQRYPVLAAPSAAFPTTAAVTGALAGGQLNQETISSIRAVATKQHAADAGSHSLGSSLEASMPAAAALGTAYGVDCNVDSKLSGGSDAFVDGLFVDDFRPSPKVDDLFG